MFGVVASHVVGSSWYLHYKVTRSVDESVSDILHSHRVTAGNPRTTNSKYHLSSFWMSREKCMPCLGPVRLPLCRRLLSLLIFYNKDYKAPSFFILATFLPLTSSPLTSTSVIHIPLWSSGSPAFLHFLPYPAALLPMYPDEFQQHPLLPPSCYLSWKRTCHFVICHFVQPTVNTIPPHPSCH